VTRSDNTAKALIKPSDSDNIRPSSSKNVPCNNIPPRKHSINHDRGPGEVNGIPSVGSNSPSVKRRKVELGDAPVAFLATSRNGMVETTRNSTETSSTSIYPSIRPQESPPSNAAISTNTSSRTTGTSTTQEGSIASSSKIQHSAFPSTSQRKSRVETIKKKHSSCHHHLSPSISRPASPSI